VRASLLAAAARNGRGKDDTMERHECDVLVAGGGMAGIAAAVASARSGAETTLIDNAGWLGGMGITGATGLHSFFNVFDAVPGAARTRVVGGIAQELVDRVAARGGGIAKYPWGDDLPAEHRGGRDTALEPVDAYEPNGYGLYGMASGVHEWCADWYADDYYAVSPSRNPTGPASSPRKVARGGSWRHHVRFTRCAARSALAPDKQFTDFGFRVVRTLG